MRLPNGDRAIIDRRKIVEYSLSEEHDDGKHKAHLFRRLLGMTVENAERLIDALADAAANGDAVAGQSDRYGERYVIDFVLSGPAAAVTVRSVWIIRAGESVPRLVSCYIL